MNRFVFALCVGGLCVACGGGQSTGEPDMADMSWDAVAGTWVGIGVQVEPAQEWAIEVTLLGMGEGDSRGYVHYPEQNCGGALLEAEQAAEDQGFLVEESISYGRDRCFNGGSFRFMFGDGDGLSWEWIYPNGEVGATGELSPSAEPPTSMPY